MGACADFAVEDDQRRGGLEGVAQAVELLLVVAGFERQVQHGQGEHHLREVARGLREGLRQERRLAAVLGVIGPEVVHGDQVRELLLDREVVIVVLGPFLGVVEFLEETPARLPALGVCGEEGLSRLLFKRRALEAARASARRRSAAFGRPWRRACRSPAASPSPAARPPST